MGVRRVISRRQFVQLGAAGLASATLAAKHRSIVDGLHIGIQTYSLRRLRYPELIPAIQQTGIAECELVAGQIEPTAADQPDIVKWRDTVSLDYFKDMRKKFNRAGIDIFTYTPRLGAGRPPRGANPGAPAAAAPPQSAPPVTDSQIDRAFEFAKALGAKNISSGFSSDMATRIAPFAEKHKIVVAVASTNPELLKEVPAISPWLRIDLDIGDFTRAGYDALQFVKDNYEHLLDIHLKDCKFRGESVPFGTGDSHMKEVLQFLAGKKTQVRAMVDCDYPGTGASVDEVKKCYEYVRSCLA
jgi:sugar phosphate isomerase/epimerase